MGNEVATRGVISWPEAFKKTEWLLRQVGLNEPPGRWWASWASASSS